MKSENFKIWIPNTFQFRQMSCVHTAAAPRLGAHLEKVVEHCRFLAIQGQSPSVCVDLGFGKASKSNTLFLGRQCSFLKGGFVGGACSKKIAKKASQGKNRNQKIQSIILSLGPKGCLWEGAALKHCRIVLHVHFSGVLCSMAMWFDDWGIYTSNKIWVSRINLIWKSLIKFGEI